MEANEKQASEMQRVGLGFRWQWQILLGVVISVTFLCGGAGFLWPWRQALWPDSVLERWAPVEDGRSSLWRRLDGGETPAAWVSETARLIPPVAAMTGTLPEAVRFKLVDAYPQLLDQGRISGGQIFEIRSRELARDGKISEYASVIVRENRGQFLVGMLLADGKTTLVFDPPVLQLPANPLRQQQWESTGLINQTLAYRWTNQVEEIGPAETGLGSQARCLLVYEQLEVDLPNGTTRQQSHRRYCEHLGLVENNSLSADRTLITQERVVSMNTQTGGSAAAFPAGIAQEPPPGQGLLDPSNGTLHRFARSRPSGMNNESSFAPVYVPGEPPLLLAAAVFGDLVAFEVTPGAVSDAASDTVSDTLPPTAWSFHLAGAIFGRPAWDARRGRVYFGASDKKVYALDQRGLFLWAFPTGDNVASSPLLLEDVLIFGSEDQWIYALDAEDGRLRWRFKTGGPVVTSAVRLGDLALMGSDDGTLYALDAASGEVRWTLETGASIEADARVLGPERVLFGSRSGQVVLVDAQGEEVWSTELRQGIRCALAADAGQVYGVDINGRAFALDLTSGRVLWTTAEMDYAGSPVIVQGGVLLATTDGRLVWLSAQGKELAAWAIAETALPGDAANSGVKLSPVAAGGRIWLADDGAVLRWFGGEP